MSGEFHEDPDTGCWIWRLGAIGGGYGVRVVDGRPRLVHRLHYEELVGPIPEGLVIDHLCRTPRCVNPGHLEPVTQRENVLRGDSPHAQNARKTHCPQGHPYDNGNTYRIPATGHRKCLVCKRAQQRAWKRRQAALAA